MTETQAQGDTALAERQPLLEIDNLSVTFNAGCSQTRAVDGVSYWSRPARSSAWWASRARASRSPCWP